MQNVINLLPDAIANQIAAGEVVQRPASVVKELLENAIDAGADTVQLVIKDAGKALVQVTDNGSGMSAADARMSFERHATSKIKEQSDLFNIHTLGFRGEALSSIAAVAQVKLRTRLKGEELGTELEISGSKVGKQESCACPEGTTFLVRNLFFNVPARRNFLKSNPVETRHILNEFVRVALANPQVALSFTHDGHEVYNLGPGDLKLRICDLLDSKLEDKMIRLDESAGYVKISGFIADASYYKNKRGDQFFFANGRFIKSNYLHHAIATVFEDFIPEDTYPFYCIFLEVDPVHIDINIHPTKTEVKFDDEKTLYILLQSTIKQALAESHQIPHLDTKSANVSSDIYTSSFPKENKDTVGDFSSFTSHDPKPKISRRDWESFYNQEQARSPDPPAQQSQLFQNEITKARKFQGSFFVQMSQTYILTSYEDNLYIIHQELAHQRIIYERLISVTEDKKLASQQLLFPQTLNLGAKDILLLKDAEPVLQRLGFEIREFSNDSIIVYGMPAEISSQRAKDIFDEFLSDLQEVGMTRVEERLQQSLARAVAMKSAIPKGQTLSETEMKKLVSDLFECNMAARSLSDGRTWWVIPSLELEKYFG